ncbi:MAG: hypothetical protein H0W96_09575 [Solirubrobacterales bacterium]|nr:hypothetical protein [Solirubrobacterales bacterium]
MLLADEDEEALERLGDVLAALGHEVMSFAVSVEEAADLIVRETRTSPSSSSTGTTRTHSR